jgi:hypothetical protein
VRLQRTFFLTLKIKQMNKLKAINDLLQLKNINIIACIFPQLLDNMQKHLSAKLSNANLIHSKKDTATIKGLISFYDTLDAENKTIFENYFNTL